MENVDSSKKKTNSGDKKNQLKKVAATVAQQVGYALIVGAASALGARAINSIAQRTKTGADIIPFKKAV